MADYHILRFFLTLREHPPLLSHMKRSRLSRDEYLKKAFSGQIYFEHRGKRHAFKHIKTVDSVIVAGIGKSVIEDVNLPPERDFEPTQATFWKAANIFLDTAGDIEGQKVAVEYHGQVGKPLAVIASLVSHINKDADSDWVIAVNEMYKEQDFWNVVKTHKGTITEISFHFVPPNILRGTSTFEQEMKEIAQETNNHELNITLKNSDGNLELENSERVQTGVKYTSKGGGTVKLKEGRKKIYDSQSSAIIEKVEDSPEAAVASEGMIKNLIKRLLNRDEQKTE